MLSPIRCLWATLVLCLTVTPALYGEGTDDRSAQRLISLVEYIAGDYTEAVQQAQIVNAAEYEEMRDFAAAAARELEKLASKLPKPSLDESRANLADLATLIEQKADVEEIRALTTAVKNRVIAGAGINTTPPSHPDWHEARALYAQHCASCHGADGRGDGPAGQGLEPPPRDFHEQAVLDVSSPFKFYNTLVLGVEGTAMVSYAETLTDDQLWSLAFLTLTLKNGPASPEAVWAKLPEATVASLRQNGLSLALLARSSGDDLRAWLEKSPDLDAEARASVLIALRSAAPFLAETPRNHDPALTALATHGATEARDHARLLAKLAYAEDKVRAAKAAFAASDRVRAESLLLDAYLEGYEGVEGVLGITHADLVRDVEQSFIAARQAARAGDSEAFATRIAALENGLASSRAQLEAPTPSALAGTGEFLASLVIILREGFEAFLIVGALLTLLSRMGAHAAKKWVHAGWITAIIAGFASYYLFTLIFDLSGAARETIEAIATGAAALVLFYVSFWLLNQVERGKWERYISKSVQAAASSGGKVATLFFLAFIAVYREAAETVLFYQALTTSSASIGAVVAGFIAGLVALLVICGLIMWLGVRLPLRRFFLMTSAVMILISIVLVGKAVNELVEAGFVQPTIIANLPVIDVLGIYPNWESVGMQIIAASAAALIAWLSVRARPASSTRPAS